MKVDIEKIEPLYNGLIRKGIDPFAIRRNAAFLLVVRAYMEGHNDIITTLDYANKINILNGNKYSINQLVA